MIALTALAHEFTLNADLVAHMRQQGGLCNADEVYFTRAQAARVLLINDFKRYWPTLGRDDLLAIYRKTKDAFNSPPTMTYELILSPSLQIRVIPRMYLSRIDIAFVGAA